MQDRNRWNERYQAGRGSTPANPRLPIYAKMLRRGLALDLAGGNGRNAALLVGWKTIVADISDEALNNARGWRVLADAAALPFADATFDTILCAYFFDPRVDFEALLKPGGALFFETYTTSDAKYRPDFPAAYRLDPAKLSRVFRGIDMLAWQELDDGTRVVGTFVGIKR